MLATRETIIKKAIGKRRPLWDNCAMSTNELWHEIETLLRREQLALLEKLERVNGSGHPAVAARQH